MHFKRISFDLIEIEIKNIFSSSELQKINLIPDDINDLARNAGIELQWKNIDWWPSFENGIIDVAYQSFIIALFEKIIPNDREVIIVTDECFVDQSGYYLDFNDFEEFSKKFYPDIYKLDFFQPQDFIFLFPNDKLLTILSHEGYVMQYKAVNRN